MKREIYYKVEHPSLEIKEITRPEFEALLLQYCWPAGEVAINIKQLEADNLTELAE
jgi:hypothetical protein